MPKHPISTRLMSCLALIGALCAPSVAQVSLSAGPTQLIYPSSEPIADAVAATLKRNSTTMWLWRSTWNRTVKYYGTAANPQQTVVSPSNQQNKDIFTLTTTQQNTMRVSSHPLPIVSTIPGYKCVSFYLKNVIDLGNGEVLGLLHLEYLAWVKQLDQNKQWTGKYIPGYDPVLGGASYYSIGLAYSTNSGDTWNFLGDIVRTHDKTPNIGAANIGGAAYLRVNSDIYVYFNEKPSGSDQVYPAVAKARLSDIWREARLNRTTPWKKYNAATQLFDQDGIDGLGSQVIAGGGMDMHTDAAYCAPLKRYLMVVNNGGLRTLKIFRSTDGINWVAPSFLASSYIAPTTGKLHQPCYPYFYSLDTDANSDNSVVGNKFHLFYINQYFIALDALWQPTDEPVYRVSFKVADNLPVSNLLN